MLTREAAKAGVSSFAYQGTNSHVIIGGPCACPARVQQPLRDWRHRRFWFQVRFETPQLLDELLSYVNCSSVGLQSAICESDKVSMLQVTSHPLLWTMLKAAARGAAEVKVQALLGRPSLAFLWDHTVQGRTILPGAVMCEMVVAAGKVPSHCSSY